MKDRTKMTKADRKAEDKAMRIYISPLQEMLASRRRDAQLKGGEATTTLVSTKHIKIVKG